MILINATNPQKLRNIKQSVVSKQLPGTLRQLKCHLKACELSYLLSSLVVRNNASNKPKTARESYRVEIIEFHRLRKFQDSFLSSTELAKVANIRLAA